MNLFRKTFLMFVGMASMALDEVEKSLTEASEVIEERRQKFAKKSAETAKAEPSEPAVI